MLRAPASSSAELADVMTQLNLCGDGPAFTTMTSVLQPVILNGGPAMLKLTHQLEEIAGAHALREWDGAGAVRILACAGDAMVLERAGETLRSRVSDDARATQLLCAVAARLHAHPVARPDRFPTLQTWFASLFADTRAEFDVVREIAEQLLTTTERPVLLHGDLHHENVLDGGPRGWLAIDPKGIVGTREFDYLNLFTNWTPEQAVSRFDARLQIVTGLAGIERKRLLRWIAAWSALSGIWHQKDGRDDRAAFPHTITALALDRLNQEPS